MVADFNTGQASEGVNIRLGSDSPTCPSALGMKSFLGQRWAFSGEHGLVEIVKDHRICTDPSDVGWMVYPECRARVGAEQGGFPGHGDRYKYPYPNAFVTDSHLGSS